MRILFSFMLGLWLVNAQAQEEVRFNFHYTPETSYHITNRSVSVSELTYSGSDAFLAMLEQNGMAAKMRQPDTSHREMLITTGKIDALKEFPITIELQRFEQSQGNLDLPPGIKIYGNTTMAGLPEIDSISETGRGPEFEQMMLQTMQAVFGQIDFPDTTLAVGESFTEVTPFTIPVASTAINMKIFTEYKLLSLIGDVAEFKVDQVFEMDSHMNELSVEGSGSGAGKLKYSVEHQYILDHVSNTRMKAHVAFEQFALSIDQVMDFHQQTAIKSLVP